MLGRISQHVWRNAFPAHRKGGSRAAGIFSAGGTTQRDLPHLEKARILLGYYQGWKTKAVAAAAGGLARACGRVDAPRAADPKTAFVRKARCGRLAGGFVLVVWAGWPLFLGAQSGGVPLVSELPTEQIDGASILRAPAVIGMWKRQIVVQLHRRMHASGGSRTVRKYICDSRPT